MDVAITGSGGLIGSALATSLRHDGHRVRPVVRRPAAAPDEISMDALDLSGVGAVVNLAGEPIGAKRWNDEQKRLLRDSRIETTKRLAAAIASTEPRPVFLSGSAIGIYGNRGDEVLTEASPPGHGFLAQLSVDWEAAAQPAVDAGARVALLRTGIVLAPRGGALKKLLPLFKAGLGGRMGSGKQWMSWISIDDEVGAIRHLLTTDASGAYNLTAPNPVTNAELAKTLGRVLRRPAVVPVPSFGPRLVLGKELAATLLEDSQRILPERLVASGFAHQHATLEDALRSLLAK